MWNKEFQAFRQLKATLYITALEAEYVVCVR